jgi:hypothetical protein
MASAQAQKMGAKKGDFIFLSAVNPPTPLSQGTYGILAIAPIQPIVRPFSVLGF